MVSYVVDIALSVTHLGKIIRGHFDLVLGILNFAFKYGPDRIEQKQQRDRETVYSANECTTKDFPYKPVCNIPSTELVV